MLTSFFCTVVLLRFARMAGMTFQERASGWMHSCLQQASFAWLAEEHQNGKEKTEAASMPGMDSRAVKAKCPVDPLPGSVLSRNTLGAYGIDKLQDHALPTADRTHAAFNLRCLIDVSGQHRQNKHLKSQSMNNVFKQLLSSQALALTSATVQTAQHLADTDLAGITGGLEHGEIQFDFGLHFGAADKALPFSAELQQLPVGAVDPHTVPWAELKPAVKKLASAD